MPVAVFDTKPYDRKYLQAASAPTAIEWRFHEFRLNSETVDNFLRTIGAGMDYVAAGHSFYSAETHIRHLGEAKLGDTVRGELQIISADEKRFRSFVRVMVSETCVATIEQLCLHVNMAEGKSAPASAEVWAKLKSIADAHASLPLPEGAGRAVGQKK